MADMAASVLARLKNKAKENGRSYQLCLQLFCQEEFLRRLEKYKYGDYSFIPLFRIKKNIEACNQYLDTVSFMNLPNIIFKLPFRNCVSE